MIIKSPLLLLGRDEEKLKLVESYLKTNKMFRNYSDPSEDPVFSEVRVCGVFYEVLNFLSTVKTDITVSS